jgi:hypothetical protein
MLPNDRATSGETTKSWLLQNQATNEPIKDHRPQEKGSPGIDPLVPEEINKPIKDKIQKTDMEDALTTFDD